MPRAVITRVTTTVIEVDYWRSPDNRRDVNTLLDNPNAHVVGSKVEQTTYVVDGEVTDDDEYRYVTTKDKEGWTFASSNESD
jgi:hypothetical protein